MATYWLPDNSTVDTHSDAILGTTDSSINDGWQRLSVTFTVPANATKVNCNIMIRDASGKAWFDGIQLEEGTSASPFNMVNNSSFELYSQNSDGTYVPQDWSGYLTDSVNNAHYKDAGHAFRFSSVPTVAKEINQQLYLGGTTAQNLDDTYILSGWVYANPVGGSNENNKISLAAKVFYSDGTSYLNWFNYNSSIQGWQYIMGAFTLRDGSNTTATKTPTSIKIYLINYRQSNNSWFDNIQLVRDEAPSYTYNSDGKLISTVANAQQKSSMEYSNGNLTKSVDAKGFAYSYTYDSNHNMMQATSQGGTKYIYTYDSNGNPTSLKIKTSSTTSIDTGATYTSNGAYVSQTSDQDGYTESYNYDDSRGILNKYTDKKGNETNYTYDANTDAITSVSQTLSNRQTVSNSYTYNKYCLNTISHNGFNYSFVYDDFGNVTQTKVGTQTLSTNTYGANNGDLNRVTYGNGNYVDYTYDDYGNITAISQNGTQNFTWKYDSTGNLYSHEDLVNNQRFIYTYDTTGRLVRQNVLNNSKKSVYASEYGYDLNNNVSRFTSSAGGTSVTESFEYGTDNLATKYTYPSGKTATYTNDGLLRRNSTVINTDTPINHQFVYLMSARGGDTRTTKIGWEHINNYIYAYTYDANGNITLITRRDKSVSGSTYEKQQQFAYDELNQLIRADDLAKNCTEVYTYDNGGNILSTVRYPLTWGSLDGVTATRTTSYAYDDTNWKDKLTSYNGIDFTYDEIGNPLQYKGFTLTWQNGRQLASMQLMQMRFEFTYDVDGLRTSKKIPNVGSEHKYYYVGSRLQYETLSDDSALYYFYDSDGNPSGIRYKTGSTFTDYYYVCNWRGNVVEIYNSAGVLVASYDYNAWGVTTTHSTDADTQNIADLNPLRYRGYYYDSETSMYYVNSRYYDPATKRFLNSDNWNILKSQSDLYDKNLYSYCDNNPLMNKDLDGNIWIAAVAVGVGSQYASDIICNLIAGEKGKDIFIPTSSLGDYISAGVTALIPGSGITSALMRSVVSVGISGIENSIKGEKFTIAQYSMDFLGNLLLDVGVSAVAGKVSRLIDSKLPKNYSTYAGQQYKKHAQITARQISKKMANKYKLGRGAANVFEFMLNTIGNVL